MSCPRGLRWLLLYPLLAAAVVHTSITGSPIPLWHIETLDNPLRVTAVRSEGLLVEDGRLVPLPFIRELPHDNPLFRIAIARGVDVAPDGSVHGLVWRDRACGNDPVVWSRVRVNLSELAGALHPGGIDQGTIHPEAVALYGEDCRIDLAQPSRSHRNGHLTLWDFQKMRWVRRIFESPAE